MWDGLTTLNSAPVLVLGATNRPEQLDAAVQRRFSRSYEIGLPGKDARLAILRLTLRNMKVSQIMLALTKTVCG